MCLRAALMSFLQRRTPSLMLNYPFYEILFYDFCVNTGISEADLHNMIHFPLVARHLKKTLIDVY